MSEPFTVVYRGLTSEQRSLITLDPKAVWFGHCHAPHERDEASAAAQAAQPEAVGLIRAMLHNAMDRMDRARNLLTDGNPRPECNWGMLDTSDLRKALASAPTPEPMSAPTAEPVAWTNGIQWHPKSRYQSEQVVKLTRTTQPEHGYTIPLYATPPRAAQPEAVPYETWLALREGHFNAASEEYFAARPQLDSAANRRIFYAGHCKGYDAAAPTTEATSSPSDAERLDWLREECCDLRCISSPTGGDDYDIRWVVIQHHMAKPHEREIGESYTDEPRDAIDAAIRATKGGKL